MTCESRRPCERCVKRGIAQLCTDDRPPTNSPQSQNPRETDSSGPKISKSQHSNSAAEDDGSPLDQLQSSLDNGMSNSFEQSQEQSQDNSLGLGTTTLSQGGPLQLVQPSPISGLQANALNSNGNQCKPPIALASSESN